MQLVCHSFRCSVSLGGGDTIVVLPLVGKFYPVFGVSVGLRGLGRGDEGGEGERFCASLRGGRELGDEEGERGEADNDRGEC